MLIVTTASRSWPAEHNRIIVQALEVCMNTAFERGETLAVRVGGARGGDQVIYQWAATAYSRRWAVDRPQEFAAQWRADCVPGRCKPGHRRVDNRGSVCPLQGYVRNELMVDTLPKPELCLAFIHAGSRGATQCAEYAEAQGVETVPFRL